MTEEKEFVVEQSSVGIFHHFLPPFIPCGIMFGLTLGTNVATAAFRHDSSCVNKMVQGVSWKSSAYFLLYPLTVRKLAAMLPCW